MRVAALISIAAIAAGCASSPTEKKPQKPPCAPATLGMPNALPVMLWTPPAGCRANSGSGQQSIQSEEQWQAAFACAAKTPSGIDFTMHDLVVAHRMLSPAQVGTDLYDDGKTITFVGKQRSPCPKDPQPMPIGQDLSFLVPARATRLWAEKVCTLETTCP